MKETCAEYYEKIIAVLLCKLVNLCYNNIYFD